LVATVCLTFPLTAQAAEPGTVPDVSWGISPTDQARTVALMKEAGVKWARMNISWESIEPNGKGSIDPGYIAEIDGAVDRVRAAGINIVMPMSDGTPYWASSDPNRHTDSSGKHWNVHYPPSNMNDYADAIRYVVNHYKEKGVHVYEVWNEPNHAAFWPSGPNPGHYVQMLRAAYPAIKAVDPSATVLGAALADNDYRFLEGIYAAGGGSYFDAVSTHSYPLGDPNNCWNDSNGRRSTNAFCSIEEIRGTMTANGDSGKQIWIDELGWSNCSNSDSTCWGFGVTESQQADYMTKAFEKLDASYPYVKAAFAYSFRNVYWQNESPSDWGGNLGLLRKDFSKKPAYEAFKAYATGSGATEPPSPPPPPPADQAPTVRLTAPVAGAVFYRSLAIAADAHDDHRVARVEIRVDGKLVATERTAPYAVTWKVPKNFAYGEHLVEARGFDDAGQSAAARVSVVRSRSTRKRRRILGRASGSDRRGRVLARHLGTAEHPPSRSLSR
jgi:polysaccharide biosynthesis protein PslG